MWMAPRMLTRSLIQGWEKRFSELEGPLAADFPAAPLVCERAAGGAAPVSEAWGWGALLDPKGVHSLSAVELGAGCTPFPALLAHPSERVREQGAHYLQGRLFSSRRPWLPGLLRLMGGTAFGSVLLA